MLSLLVALATLAALTLTGDRRQIVGANDNILPYVMREVLFDPYAAAKCNISFKAFLSRHTATSHALSTKYIVTARSCPQLQPSPLQQHGLSAASLGHSAAQVATDSDSSVEIIVCCAW